MFMLLPLLFGLGYTLWRKAQPQPTTPPMPSPASAKVVESEEAIRRRLAKTGRSSTIFTGGMFDNPAGRKEKLIPV